MAADNRQRFIAGPQDEQTLLEIREVCNLLRGFSNGSPAERRKYARAYELAEEAFEKAHSDVEAVKRHDGDPKAMPWFQHGSLYYFELVLSYVTGTPIS